MPDFRNKAEFEDVRAIRLSDSGAALLCDIDGEEVWIPVSQIDDDSEIFEEGHEGKLVVSEWLATQKGLI
jgi:hypothetical protein